LPPHQRQSEQKNYHHPFSEDSPSRSDPVPDNSNI
ncbi:hypothetical protein A2U01_0094191, partial [Trifolium medium]|nr:hypothetical protein [Trifolium medium]